MKNKFFFLSLMGLSFIANSKVFAADQVGTKIHNFYQSNRAMGMGNAFSAAADDYAALFYNPANLSFRSNGEIQFNLISGAFTAQAPTMFKDIDDAGKTAGTDNDKATAVSNILEKYYGKPVGARISPIEYFWVRPNWGIALVVADISLDSMVQRQVGPSIDLNVIKDASLSYAYSHLIKPDMSIGVLGKLNHRNLMAGSYSSLDLALDSNVIDFKKSNEGINLDFDIGFTWKPDLNAGARAVAQSEMQETPVTQSNPAPTPKAEVKTEQTLKAQDIVQPIEAPKVEGPKPEADGLVQDTPPAVPTVDEIDTKTDGIQIRTRKIKELVEVVKPSPLTLSAVLRNVISMKYSKTNMINKDATEGPKANDRVMDLGVAYDIYQGDWTNLKAVGEVKNLMHSEASFNKCAHLGLEYSVLSSSWFTLQLRAGMSQMYYTAGIGMVLGVVNLEAVTYADEYGTADLKIENRVNAVTLGLKF